MPEASVPHSLGRQFLHLMMMVMVVVMMMMMMVIFTVMMKTMVQLCC